MQCRLTKTNRALERISRPMCISTHTVIVSGERSQSWMRVNRTFFSRSYMTTFALFIRTISRITKLHVVHIPIGFISILIKFKPSDFLSIMAKDWIACCTLLSRCQLARRRLAQEVNDVDLQRRSCKFTASHRRNCRKTCILSRMPRWWER